MRFDRYEAKMAARQSMRQARPHPMLVALVFILITSVVTTVIVRLVGSPWVEAISYINRGYDPYEVFEFIFLHNTGRVVVFAGLDLLLSLYGCIMSFGYTSYCLRLARNEQPGYRNIFDGFAKVGRVLWMNILTSIFIFLWTLLFMAPGLAGVAIAAVTDSTALFFLAWLLYMAGLILAIVVTYRYRLAVYYLIDDPDCTAREAITRSKLTMRGRKGELFALDMSFLGWLILGAFTFGILYLWLNPYMGAAEANFYDAVTGPSRPGGGFTGPVYESGPGDGPQPF